ncbi:hypothetical protein IE996_30905 [Klebsiella pneumoniae]|uniref:Uncharacterized protein n=1 Tax=Klebsiella pneumoniae TaxID=573 RepID=A0A927HQI4_KLEPN|nr:hypothetical protein [Klebsiella pneumoniae]
MLAKINGKPAAGNWFAGKRDLLLGLTPCHCMTLVLVSNEQPAREEYRKQSNGYQT